jgi:hypothetical protein
MLAVFPTLSRCRDLLFQWREDRYKVKKKVKYLATNLRNVLFKEKNHRKVQYFQSDGG